MPPSSWKKYKLKNLAATITRGISPTYSQQGIYVLNQKCIRNGKISYTHARFHYNTRKKVNDQKYLQQSDTLVCSTGVGTLGRVGRFTETIPNISTVDSHVTIVRPNQKIFPLFLSYAMIDKQSEIELLAEGTTGQTELSRTKLGELEISLPPMEEQKRIAGVLGAFDDKIELLQKQNKTLENMAKAIFKSWFVDFDVVHAKQQGRPKTEVMREYHLTEEMYELFPSSFEDSSLGPIPTGWQVKTVQDLGDIICGKTPSTTHKEYFGGDTPFITIPDMHNNIFIYQTERYLTKAGEISQSSKTLPPYSVCVSCIATPGLVSLTTIPSQTNQQINSVIPFNLETKYYNYYILRSVAKQIARRGSGGSVFGNLNKTAFSKIPILWAIEKLQIFFTQKIEILFNKIQMNNKQIQTLTEMRDALLPRLISGKIRV